MDSSLIYLLCFLSFCVFCGARLQMRMLAISILRIYKYTLSPLLPPSCRFTPTCSEYALEAISRYGFWKGSGLGLRRLLRCHPFCPGGYDPVR